jgi:uncharacterized protein (DUF2236 family)
VSTTAKIEQNEAASSAADRAAPHPLDPEGLLWRYFGRILPRRLVTGLRTPLLQNMHPELGAGVAEHSVFFQDPVERGRRSIGPIMSVVYGGDTSHDWGKLIRGFHVGIKGTDRFGRSYNALNPDTFFWAHATFVEDIVTGQSLIGFPLSEADTQALYQESIDWYRLFGVSMKPVPPDWDGFRQYWEYTVENVLEDTRPVREGFRMDRTAPPRNIDRLPGWVNAIVGPYVLKPALQAPLMRLAQWLAIASLPPAARERLCLEWSRTDQLTYQLYLKAVHVAVAALPESKQFHPVAQQARTHWLEHDMVEAIPLPVDVMSHAKGELATATSPA